MKDMEGEEKEAAGRERRGHEGPGGTEKTWRRNRHEEQAGRRNRHEEQAGTRNRQARGTDKRDSETP